MKNLLVGLALLVAALGAVMLKPAPLAAAPEAQVDLETLIPKQFGNWHAIDSIEPLQATPDQEAALKKIYSQILTRTYVDSRGRTIMLSVVYGDGINQQLDVHRPEYCYPAQGFAVSQYVDQSIPTPYGSLPVRRLVASRYGRVEPISYWVEIGDKAMSSTFERKLQKIEQGFTGRVSSGMLVRVSSIDNDKDHAYQVQASFITDLLQALPADQRTRLIGG